MREREPLDGKILLITSILVSKAFSLKRKLKGMIFTFNYAEKKVDGASNEI